MGFFFSLHQFSDFALLALRIALGAVFLTHGLGKRKLWSMQPSAQMPAGMLRNLRILSIAEPAGALGMLVGFLTQLAALGLVIAMLGCASVPHHQSPPQVHGRNRGLGIRIHAADHRARPRHSGRRKVRAGPRDLPHLKQPASPRGL